MSTVTTDEIHNYQMPTVEHGAVVAWYPQGLPSDRPEVGYVIRVQHRGLNIMTATRGVKDVVRHITDPKLKLNADHREGGAWDFTDEYKARKAEIEALHKRVTALEALLANTAECPDDEPYRALRQRAIEAGISFRGNPARGWLMQQLADQVLQLTPVGVDGDGKLKPIDELGPALPKRPSKEA